uniref:Large envelope protein n=1 Tax=Hepatitis B virus TaxID=10407 RepID=A0A8F3CIQ7_HBV|nr:MAG: S protein [Hepatitis B virus]
MSQMEGQFKFPGTSQWGQASDYQWRWMPNQNWDGWTLTPFIPSEHIPPFPRWPENATEPNQSPVTYYQIKDLPQTKHDIQSRKRHLSSSAPEAEGAAELAKTIWGIIHPQTPFQEAANQSEVLTQEATKAETAARELKATTLQTPPTVPSRSKLIPHQPRKPALKVVPFTTPPRKLAPATGRTTLIPPTVPTPIPPKPSNMDASSMWGALGYLTALQGAFFSWTKTQEMLKTVDSWWTSLSFPGSPMRCLGLGSPLPISPHSPSYCPPTCSGYRSMCLRRSIIFLLLLTLLLVCLLVYLDFHGLILMCGTCPPECSKTCTTAENKTCCCCCEKTGDTCTCPNVPWAFVSFLWELALARFSWLSFLQYCVNFFVEHSTMSLLLLIWMTLYWGANLTHILFLLFTLYWTFYRGTG